MIVFGTDLPEKVTPFIGDLMSKSFRPLCIAVVCACYSWSKDILEKKYSRDLDWRNDIDYTRVKIAGHEVHAVAYGRILRHFEKYDVIVVVKQGMSDKDYQIFHGMAIEPEQTKLMFATPIPTPPPRIQKHSISFTSPVGRPAKTNRMGLLRIS
jgi:hypothetical protein